MQQLLMSHTPILAFRTKRNVAGSLHEALYLKTGRRRNIRECSAGPVRQLVAKSRPCDATQRVAQATARVTKSLRVVGGVPAESKRRCDALIHEVSDEALLRVHKVVAMVHPEPWIVGPERNIVGLGVLYLE